MTRRFQCMQVESKSLSKLFLIFILKLLINIVLPLKSTPPLPSVAQSQSFKVRCSLRIALKRGRRLFQKKKSCSYEI